jgi:hypothetical protein
MKHHYHTHYAVRNAWHVVCRYFYTHHSNPNRSYSKQVNKDIKRFYQHYMPAKEWMQDADNF